MYVDSVPVVTVQVPGLYAVDQQSEWYSALVLGSATSAKPSSSGPTEDFLINDNKQQIIRHVKLLLNTVNNFFIWDKTPHPRALLSLLYETCIC